MKRWKLLMHVPDPARFEAALKVARNFVLALKGKTCEVRILVNYEGVKVLKDFSPYDALFKEVKELGIEIYFCETALRSLEFSPSELPQGARTVPFGIVALVEWQNEGFRYVRA